MKLKCKGRRGDGAKRPSKHPQTQLLTHILPVSWPFATPRFWLLCQGFTTTQHCLCKSHSSKSYSPPWNTSARPLPTPLLVNILVCSWLSVLLSLEMSHEEEGTPLGYEECPHEWETEEKEEQNKLWFSPSGSRVQTSRHPFEKKKKKKNLRGMKGLFNPMKQSQRNGKMQQ